MKTLQRIIMGMAIMGLAACGELSTVGTPTDQDDKAGTETSGITNTVTTGTAMVKKVPAIDPNASDSATSVVSGSLHAKSLGSELLDVIDDVDYSSSTGTLDILVTQTAPTTDTGTGTVEMFQCGGDVQDSYVNVVADNTSNDTVQYSVRMIQTTGFGNVDVSFVGDTDGAGAIKGSRTLTVNGTKDSTKYSVKFTSDGTTNTFAGNDGTYSIMCVWDTNGHGCGKVDSGSAVPFAFIEGSDGKRTYTTTTDTLCSSLPDAVASVTAPESFTGDRKYSCDVPSGCTTATPASAISLEDAGGTQCKILGGYWGTASVKPSSCGDSSSASGVGCFCDALYAQATQMVKNSTRAGLCKVMGLANNGDINLGERTDSKSVCVQDLSIGN